VFSICKEKFYVLLAHHWICQFDLLFVDFKLVVFFYTQLTPLAWAYFLVELLLILVLVYFEFQVHNTLKEV